MCDCEPPTRGIRDRQQDPVWGRCAWCGGEIWPGERVCRIGYDVYHPDCVYEEIAGEEDG